MVKKKQEDWEVERCKCDEESYEDHPCPFAEEINNDSETLCNCCSSCMRNCADDI